MIELRKNMEDSEQAESVYDPEKTLALDGMERCVSEYDPEQTSVPGVEEDETAVEKDAATEKDASVEMCAAVEKDAADEKNANAEKDAAAEKDANAAEESERSEDLTDSEVFVFDGMEFRTPSELARYFQSYADESRRALSRKVRQLYADKGHLLLEFEAWLIAIGKEKELNSWKKKIQGIR